MIWLLAPSLPVMFGIGSFEVGGALRGQPVLNPQPCEIGWLFALLIEAPFWATAGLSGRGAVAVLRVSNTLKEVTYE